MALNKERTYLVVDALSLAITSVNKLNKQIGEDYINGRTKMNK